MFNVNNEKTTKVVWDKLQSMYKMISVAYKNFIMKKLYKLKVKDRKMTSSHINELNTLLCQPNSIGMPQDDQNKAVIFLCSLLDSWDGVVMSINTSVSGKNKLVYDEVVATFLSEDMRRRNKDSSSTDALTMVNTKNRGEIHQRGRSNYNHRS